MNDKIVKINSDEIEPETVNDPGEQLVTKRTLKKRIWDIPLGPETGKPGQQIIISQMPRCIFRGERLIANDTAKIPGTGTRIKQVLVGRRLQADFRERPTYDFINGADITMDTCQSAVSIVFYIDFLENCTWWGNLVGMAAF